MSDYRQWTTLRELDAAHGAAKGTAFRSFKRLEAELAEGRDYVVLHQLHDRMAIDALRRQQRIYPGSLNVVLLGRGAAQRIGTSMR
ncbi:MAG: hypothetical protein AB1651_09225 [Pseudomonadota bacterium]